MRKMSFGLAAPSAMIWLLTQTACIAVERGCYPPPKSNERSIDGKSLPVTPESGSERELHELLASHDAVDLLVETPDKIRVFSFPVPMSKSPQSAYLSREEVAGCLKDVANKSLLRLQISTSIMWDPLEKSEAIVRELQPFIDNLAYKRVLIFAFRPYDDGHTFMHPSNGMVRSGIFVFKDTGATVDRKGETARDLE